MSISQLSIYVENKQGSLSEILSLLAENNIDMRAMSMADTADFGILRLIVSNASQGRECLEKNGFIVKITPVIGAAIDDAPGSLSKVMNVLADNGTNVEYMYAFLTKTQNSAYVVIRADDSTSAINAMTANGVNILTDEDVATM